MDPTGWGIVLGIVGIVVTVALGLPALKRRRLAPHWTTPRWTKQAMKIQTTCAPVLTARWALRGINAIQGVECAVRAPSGKWQVCSWPKGRLEPPNEGLYTHVHLVTGIPFNSTLSSPTNRGKPARDITHRAVKGRYQLRIRWYEGEKPKRRRQKVFSYVVM